MARQWRSLSYAWHAYFHTIVAYYTYFVNIKKLDPLASEVEKTPYQKGQLISYETATVAATIAAAAIKPLLYSFLETMDHFSGRTSIRVTSRKVLLLLGALCAASMAKQWPHLDRCRTCVASLRQVPHQVRHLL